MYLSKINLQNFRSYGDKTVEFSSGVNLILGENGSGKSNLIEAIYFLSSGKSFRASSLSQMIEWNKSFTSVRGKIGDVEMEAQLIKNTESMGNSRRFLINSVDKTRAKYLGNFRCVLFDPEDIRLISGSPTRRRDFLDAIFTSSEWTYASALSQYNRALKHRNELLDLIFEGKAQTTELFYWNQSLIKNAEIINKFRREFIEMTNDFFAKHEDVEIQKLSIKYYPSIISAERMKNEEKVDIRTGYTRYGPHRDDFEVWSQNFENSDKNMANWGSRGQQRLAVLAIRLAQINYLMERYKEIPVLLLDDIFSELDENHRKLVVEICQKHQTIFTSAENEALIYLPSAQIIKI